MGLVLVDDGDCELAGGEFGGVGGGVDCAGVEVERDDAWRRRSVRRTAGRRRRARRRSCRRCGRWACRRGGGAGLGSGMRSVAGERAAEGVGDGFAAAAVEVDAGIASEASWRRSRRPRGRRRRRRTCRACRRGSRCCLRSCGIWCGAFRRRRGRRRRACEPGVGLEEVVEVGLGVGGWAGEVVVVRDGGDVGACVAFEGARGGRRWW